MKPSDDGVYFVVRRSDGYALYGSPWDRFEDLAKRLLRVPAEEVREKQAEYEQSKKSRKVHQANAD
jgi:hypothetical protein